MRKLGYGSVELLRACEASAACRAIPGAGTRVAWRKMRAGSIAVARYRRRLPVVDIALTLSAAGRMIDEHFAIREEGRWRYRDAQALLPCRRSLLSTCVGDIARPSGPTSATPVALGS